MLLEEIALLAEGLKVEQQRSLMRAYVKVMKVSDILNEYLDKIYPKGSHDRDELILGIVEHDQDWQNRNYEDQMREKLAYLLSNLREKEDLVL